VTSPAPSGSSRRRIAGLALVGVGVIAAIIGLASLTLGGGGDGGSAAAPPSAGAPPSGEPGAGAPSAAPPTSSGPITIPTFPSTTANVAAPPTTEAPPAAPADSGTGQGGSGGGGGTDVAKGPIRVYNNSTITGLAADAAGDFRARGWDVGDVANYPFGIIPTTTVYYRPGTDEQAIAEQLGQEFGLRVNPRFDGLKDASPGVIVIVTNDFPRGK
jgi:hypothetical protein